MFSCAIKPVIMLIQLIKHFAKSQQCFPTVNCMQREKYVKKRFSNGHQNPSMHDKYHYLHGQCKDQTFLNKNVGGLVVNI